ncbi:MAG: SBBP repeat-containing protein [Verrucomicrobia bacterium]|nr:SBBP repeat-containing protein [Verrucomicrobiota bacterium]
MTTPLLKKLGTRDAFALKLDSSGTTTWAKNYGGGGASVTGSGIAVDGSGNVYLGGYFSSANLGTPALTKLGTRDAFALKLDSSGTTTWAKNYGGSEASAFGKGIAVDGSGNIYLGGYFEEASLTTPALTRIGTHDGFALKLDNSGTTTWAKNYGGDGAYANLGSIAADRSGNVFLGGYFQSANLTTPALTLSSSFSPLLIAAYLPEPAVPGVPTGVSAVSGNAQATVSFTAPASTGSAAITGYTVTSNPAGGTDSNAGSTSLSHVITGLTNGTSYTFTVTATNSVGTGSASSASSAVTPVGTPTITTPTSASIGSTTATLGGNVTATGGASLTAVGVVYAATSANSNPQLSGNGVTNLAGTAATGVFTVNATGLTAGTAYSYAAYATNSVGTTYRLGCRRRHADQRRDLDSVRR